MPQYDVVVIGGGPGGYVAAIRAAQLGLKAAVVERESVGGVCLNWGCIPTKTLLRNAEVLATVRGAAAFGVTFENLKFDYARAQARSRQVASRLVKGVEFLLKKNKVDLVQGEASLAAANRVEVKPSGQTLETKNIIIATGARPSTVPSLPIDGQQVLTSREVLELKEVPAALVVVGAGAIGVEFACLFRTYGSDVTLVEMLPHALPLEDEEISVLLEQALAKEGIRVMTKTKVEGLQKDAEKVRVQVSSPEGPKEVVGDKVLVAIGVRPNSEGLGLDKLGIATQRGFIGIDDKMRTNVPGIYAIGDVTGKLLLAHVASHMGVVAAEAIAGKETHALVYHDMPRCTYTRPQVASIGLTEAQAKEKGHTVKVGKFPFRANGKALAIAEHEGLVKIVSHAKYGEILGVHLIGPEVTEMISEISLAKTLEATPAEIGKTVHPHPTLSETLMEAALAVEGMAIHI